MESSKSGFQATFLWISAIIGFIVDTVALGSLIVGIITPTIDLPRLSNISNEEVKNVVLSWQELSIVLLIYVCYALFLISWQGLHNVSRDKFYKKFIFFHFSVSNLVGSTDIMDSSVYG